MGYFPIILLFYVLLQIYDNRFCVPDASNIPYRGTLSPSAFKPDI